jgi:uncharacterized protein (DUF2147 family)
MTKILMKNEIALFVYASINLKNGKSFKSEHTIKNQNILLTSKGCINIHNLLC